MTDLLPKADANGNAIVWDVYYRHGDQGQFQKDHGEYAHEHEAQAVCDRLNAERPGRFHKPRKRKGLKLSCYGVVTTNGVITG